MSSTLTSLSHETRTFAPNPEVTRHAAVPSMAAYQALYDAAQNQPEHFWEERAINLLSWKKPGARKRNRKKNLTRRTACNDRLHRNCPYWKKV